MLIKRLTKKLLDYAYYVELPSKTYYKGLGFAWYDEDSNKVKTSKVWQELSQAKKQGKVLSFTSYCSIKVWQDFDEYLEAKLREAKAKV